MRFRLLGCLAKAIAKNGVKFLCGLVPGGDVLFEIASDALEDYREGGRKDDALRTEIARAGPGARRRGAAGGAGTPPRPRPPTCPPTSSRRSRRTWARFRA